MVGYVLVSHPGSHKAQSGVTLGRERGELDVEMSNLGTRQASPILQAFITHASYYEISRAGLITPTIHLSSTILRSDTAYTADPQAIRKASVVESPP